MSEYRSELDWEDDREELEAGLLTEDLIGIEEQPMDATTQYYIITDMQEIGFRSPAALVWTATLQGEKR